jgi:hypothetical protein
MSATVTTLPLPAVPKEVSAFAAEAGVSPYLTPVLEMTRRLFPTAPLTVLIEEDPEIPNDRHIVLEVDVSRVDEDKLFDLDQRWFKEVFDHCPSTHVCVFRLGLL